MTTTNFRGNNFSGVVRRIRLQRGLAFGVIIISALLAFEIFNYSTTEFALADLLGGLSFMGVGWSTILAIAFCGIDFAGIARLFTPEEGADEPTEVWYLFGAWLLAATMNAMLTWWGISIAILNHETLGNAVVARTTLLRVVPIFVAVLVWLIRVLIIGTFSVAGDRLFSQADQRVRSGQRASAPAIAQASASMRSLGTGRSPATRMAAPAARNNYRPAPKPAPQPEPSFTKTEPTYHPVSIAAAPKNNQPGNQNPKGVRMFGSQSTSSSKRN
jgi:hypothetical protein